MADPKSGLEALGETKENAETSDRLDRESGRSRVSCSAAWVLRDLSAHIMDAKTIQIDQLTADLKMDPNTPVVQPWRGWR